jgi:predicted Rossmann fold nucleotide-binding protein DprA/Smf involved in DNA uptake
LDKPAEILLDALGFEPADVDTLVTRSGLTAQTASSLLPRLVKEERLAPGAGSFCRRAAAASSRRPK